MYYFYMGSELLPIPPEKFSLKIKNANKTLTLINEGEINILREAGLTDLEFKVLIPAVEYSFATYEDGFKPPAHYLTYFEELKTSKKPFQFIVSREFPNGALSFDTDMTVSMENYVVDENSKDVFDLMITIKLKQYREYGTKIVKVSNNVASVEEQREQSNSPAPKQETTYTVQKGDCLWNIAKKIYGDGSLYLAIYEANKDKITQPYSIYPGQVLVIPSASDAKITASSELSEALPPVSNAVVAPDMVSDMNENYRQELGFNKVLTVKTKAAPSFVGELTVMCTPATPLTGERNKITSSTKELEIMRGSEVIFIVQPKMGCSCTIEITEPGSTKVLQSYFTKKGGTYKITLSDDSIATVRWLKS